MNRKLLKCSREKLMKKFHTYIVKWLVYMIGRFFHTLKRSDFMRAILNKGHRIRASDKYLLYRFCAGTLLSLFLLVLLLLNVEKLLRTD